MVQCACFAGEVDSDAVDDELCPLNGCGAIAIVIDCALGDDVALFYLFSPVSRCAVAVGAGEGAGNAATGTKIKLHTPLTVALTEVEAVAIHLAVPLLRCQPAVATHDDIVLGRQPCLEVGFGGLFVGGDLLDCSCFPEGVVVVVPLFPTAAAILLAAGATASEP